MLERQHQLDLAFRALSDPTRRLIVEALSSGPKTVSALAQPFDMSLAAIVQHIQVLETSGLIRTEKQGRTRLCRLDADRIAQAEGWLSERRQDWSRRLDRLGAFLEANPDNKPSSRRSKEPKQP